MIYAIMIILGIVGIKAIFSASDTAFTYINRAEINQLSKQDKKAQKIKMFMEDSNKFFGIVEVGINMCELLASAVASITIVEYLAKLLENYKITTELAMLISVMVVTIVLAYIMLVFGGVLPKRIARNHPKKVAYQLLPALWVVAQLNYPFEKLIDVSTNCFSKILKIKKEPVEKMTEKQLKMMIQEAQEEGVLKNIEKRIFMNTLKANNMSAQKAMIPMDKAELLNMEDTLSSMLKKMQENQYTRIPVYQENKNQIIGILNVKDVLIKHLQDGIKSKKEIEELVRIPIFIPKEEKIFTVFKELQRKNQMMGIVVEEDKTAIGLITMEDILEKLVGKIFDENDKRM